MPSGRARPTAREGRACSGRCLIEGVRRVAPVVSACGRSRRGGRVSASAYLAGVLVLAGVIVPLALASRAIVRRVVPLWVGAMACLAHVVVFLALLFALAQLVGTFGWLRRVPLVVAAVALGTA